MSGLLAKNATANIVQMVVSTLLVLALYKFISGKLGVDALGVWSVILASVSAARLSEFGLSASVTRFVALYLANGDRERIPELVATASITLVVGIALLLPVFYLTLVTALPYIFTGNYRDVAESILPYALLSFWLSTVSGVIFSTLDGLQRMVVRSYIFMAGQVVFTFLGILLVGYFDILGLAYAQIVQGIFLVAAGCFVLGRELRDFSIFRYRFSSKILREMLGYGVNVQAGVLFMSMLDPITKAFITRYDGPASAGYFEIANQVVSRARAFITSANQAVIPHIASIDYRSVDFVPDFYAKNLQIVTYVALPLFGVLVSWSHILSYLILGDLNVEFIYIFLIVAAGWMVNLFSSPSYFINQGTGEVRLNTIAIGLMGILNIALGVLLGHFFGSLGVVVAYVLAISVGSVVLIQKTNHIYQYRLDFRGFREHLLLFWSFIGACLSAVLFVVNPTGSVVNYLVFGLSNILLFYAALKHPLFSALIRPVFNRG